MMKKWALVLFVSTLAVSACSKKPAPEENPLPSAANADESLGDSDHGKAMGLQTILFSYDAYTLSGEAKTILKANAQILCEIGLCQEPAIRLQRIVSKVKGPITYWHRVCDDHVDRHVFDDAAVIVEHRPL